MWSSLYHYLFGHGGNDYLRLAEPEMERRLKRAKKVVDAPPTPSLLESETYSKVKCVKSKGGGRENNKGHVMDHVMAANKACLYIGSLLALQDAKFMSHIGAVVTLLDMSRPSATVLDLYVKPEMGHMIIDISDTPESDLSPFLESSYAFIQRHLDQGHDVFVHCFAGMSRSATIVTYWLMKKYNLSLEDALKFLKSRRNIIRPNDSFLAQLVLKSQGV